jgi:O-antigen/teichoic acid export membrane protein
MFQKLKFFLFENGGTAQTIAKNTTWLSFGQLGSRALRAVIVIYAARFLGAENWGVFSYALGIAAFLTLFGDIGINALITRETSRDPELKSRYLSTAFFIKLALLIFCAALVLFLFPIFTNIQSALPLLPALLLVFAFDTLRDLGSALARALEKMEIEAATTVLTNAAITALGIAALLRYGTNLSLAWAYAIGSGLGCLSIFWILRNHFSHILTHFTKSLIWPIFRTAWPFGLLGIMGAVMTNTDIVMLGWLRSPAEVGYYSAAQKLILLAYVFPALLASASFPALSRFAKTDPERSKNILKKTLLISFGVAATTLALGLVFGELAFSIIFGKEYLPALPAFFILLFSVLVVFPGTLAGNALFAYNEEKYFLKFVIISTLVNIFFNLLLIPDYGISGAAVATIATQLITNALMFKKLHQTIKKSTTP